MTSRSRVTITTDGACIGNPGPGGYAAILESGGKRREFSGGFKPTTNNRMEILAVVVGLEALKQPSRVTIYSDSKYVVDAIEKGWVRRWRAKRWMRTKTSKAKNVDLWKRLLPLLDLHTVTLKWVKGHAGNPLNERADRLATTAAKGKSLPPDPGYKAGNKQAGLL